ncbi:unnamed protein product [Urochloa humidicola]
MVHNEEGAAAATRRQLTSTVWGSFRINRPAAAGGPVTATCWECGQTLRAGSSIGTSHLRRHTGTKRCQKLAAELRRRRELDTAPCSAAEAPPPGDREDDSVSPVPVEEEFFVVDDIDIAELFDDLVVKDLVNIDYVPVLAQAPSSSTRWFRQKKNERKGLESRKRCAPEDASGLDPFAHAEAEFISRDKRMWPNSAAATATVQDHSHASSESTAAVYKIG